MASSSAANPEAHLDGRPHGRGETVAAARQVSLDHLREGFAVSTDAGGPGDDAACGGR